MTLSPLSKLVLNRRFQHDPYLFSFYRSVISVLFFSWYYTTPPSRRPDFPLLVRDYFSLLFAERGRAPVPTPPLSPPPLYLSVIPCHDFSGCGCPLFSLDIPSSPLYRCFLTKSFSVLPPFFFSFCCCSLTCGTFFSSCRGLTLFFQVVGFFVHLSGFMTHVLFFPHFCIVSRGLMSLHESSLPLPVFFFSDFCFDNLLRPFWVCFFFLYFFFFIQPRFGI